MLPQRRTSEATRILTLQRRVAFGGFAIREIDYDHPSQKACPRAPPPASRVRVSGVQRFRLLRRPRPVKEQALRYVAKRSGTARDEVWDPYINLGGSGRGLAARPRARGGHFELKADERPSPSAATDALNHVGDIGAALSSFTNLEGSRVPFLHKDICPRVSQRIMG